MENLWPGSFDISDRKTPKEIIESQAKFLPSLTNHKIIAKVSSVDLKKIGSQDPYKFLTPNIVCDKKELSDYLGEQNKISRLDYDFSIMFYNSADYKYRAFFFSYNMDLYPVTFYLDSEIAHEIQCNKELEIADEKGIEELLSEIFNSSKIKTVISSMMRIS
jgi:hypothetical protein